jgi:hypothetical protein
VAFFLHGYAHTFVACITGWKSNPFALNYAHPTLTVFLMQWGINQKVDEGPIFASGHGPIAAIIAAAGMVVGNGLLSYPLSRLGYRVAKKEAEGLGAFRLLVYRGQHRQFHRLRTGTHLHP